MQLVCSSGGGSELALKTAFTIFQLPGKVALTTLKSALSPGVINTLSLAIAQGSIQTAKASQDVEIEGLDIEIDFNEERLLTTAGVSTAIAFGTLYWLGSRLQIQFRYARMVGALATLDQAVKAGNSAQVEDSLRLIDDISNPLLDPQTLQPLEASDEVKAVYEQVMKKPAGPGAMFNSKVFTNTIDDAVKIGSRAGIVLASEATEEALEAMTKRAVPIIGKLGTRIVGAALWVDTVYWLGTSAIDVGLNYLGIPEDQQRIPFLADIPGIGGLFDFSNGLGASAVDLVLTPILEGVFDLLGLEDEAEELVNALWAIIFSAAGNPLIAPFIISVLDFYIDDVDIDFNVDLTFFTLSSSAIAIDPFRLIRPEPIDVLVVWTYAIVAKIIFKAWIIPAYRSIILPK